MTPADFIEIRPCGQIKAAVSIPGSKSITNRALLLAALCEGKTVLEGVLDSEDTGIMFSALQQLGLEVEHQKEYCRMSINGCGGVFPNKEADIYIGNSGTSVRFLAAALAFADGHYRLFGKERMESRPIIDLINALRQLGADICCEKNNGCPPLVIKPAKQITNTENSVLKAMVSGNISSQYLSALLMSSPLIRKIRKCSNLEITVEGTLVSVPYIEMTLNMMQSFGINMNGDNRFVRKLQSRHSRESGNLDVKSCTCSSGFLPTQEYRFPTNSNTAFSLLEGSGYYQSPEQYFVEPDASAASYFFAAAAVCGGEIAVEGLSCFPKKPSLQGDVKFVECLRQMGCDVRQVDSPDTIIVSRQLDKPLRGITVDMNEISDTAQTLAVVALFAEGATEIRNIEHVRHKETDRISDLAAELRKFGAVVEEYQDGLRITPPQTGSVSPSAAIETYDDHRMAMSFAIAGLKLPGTVILNPQCCAKTFPEFFSVLETL